MIRILIFALVSVSVYAATPGQIPECYNDGTTPYWSNQLDYTIKVHPNYNSGVLAYSSSWSGKYYNSGEEYIHYYRTGFSYLEYIGPSYTPGFEGDDRYIDGALYHRIEGRVDCFATDPCDPGQTYDPGTDTCQDDPTYCPDPHSTYDPSIEGCKCTLPYVPSYDLNGTLSCILTDCPPIYENHNPPLPLFLTTDSPSKCNFFPMADAAVLDLDGKICCYGQEWDQDSPTCGTNEIELNGECYPIDSQDSNSSDPTDCQPGTHWDNYEQLCVLDDDPWRDANGTSGIDADNPDNNGTTPGALPTQGDMDAFEQAMDLDGVSDELGKLINSYVLVQLPVNVGGQCSNEMVKTFTILGRSYTLDLREYMSMMDEYLPIIKMLVMFLFAVTGVVIVLSGRSD